MSRLPALLLLLSLSACGYKSGLQLPPGPPAEPLLGTSKNTPTAPKSKAADVSTAQKTTDQ